MDPEERNDLAEAAGEGDEEALEELRAEHVEAIESMIEALEDEDARQMIGLGIMLAQITMADRDGEESVVIVLSVGTSRRRQSQMSAWSTNQGRVRSFGDF